MKKFAMSPWLAGCAFTALAAFARAAEPAIDEPLLEDEEEFFVFDEEGEEPSATISDPLEGLNRVTFAFNDKMYRGVLKPIARGLRVLPDPVLVSGTNFFSNLGAPVSSISALLQGDVRNSATELGRFLMNSTVGVLGLFDVATKAGLVQDEEDLGQTLGRYGIGHGFYLVIPFYGSSSLRDALGMAGNSAINPVYEDLDTGEIIAINFTSAEFTLAVDKDTYEALYDQALDPYAFIRSAWVQNRAGKVEQ